MEAAMYATLSWLAGFVFSAAILVAWLAGFGRRAAASLSITGLLASFIFSLLALLTLHEESVYTLADAGFIRVETFVDGLSAWVGFIVALLSLLIGVYSVEYMGEEGTHRYWFFFTFFVASMLLLVYAGDVLLMFIGWEGTGLASYALIGYYYDDREEAWVGDAGRVRLGVPMWFTPTHSAIRAFVFTGLGDTAFLIALAMIHDAVGSLEFTRWIHEPRILLHAIEAKYGVAAVPLVIALFFLAALAKSAQFPFHEWLVTAMTGPTSVSALIHAATMVKAGVYLAARFAPIFYQAFGALVAPVYHAYAWVAMLTAFATATMALVARELKLILAYSTASQLGYMMAAAFAAPTALGSFAATAHLMSHAMFKAALFLIAGALIHELHTRYVTEMRVPPRYMPVTAASALLAGASLAGVPVFAGFWSKDAVVAALDPAMRVVGLITAFLTAFYTTRMLLYAFNMGGARKAHEPGPLMLVPYAILAVLSLGFGIAWPSFEHMLAEALHAHPYLEPTLAATSASVSLAGIGFAVVLYDVVWRRRPPEPRGFAKLVYDFLYDRWLVNPILYRLVVYPAAHLSRLLAANVERAIDWFYHRAVPRAFWASVKASEGYIEAEVDTVYHRLLPSLAARFARSLRSAHNGDISRYLVTFITGIVVVALLVAWYTLGG